MRSKIRKHLVATFQREFEEQHPQFALSKLSDGATKIWEWRVSPSFHCFAVLHPFEQEDKFAIEIAWSEDGSFPWASMGDEFSPDRRCWRERLGRLWAPHGKEPLWDAAPEVAAARQARFDVMLDGGQVSYPPPPDVDVAIPRIGPLVDDCLQKFREYRLPVFEHVAQHRGISLSSGA
jgi:hypothetical protein